MKNLKIKILTLVFAALAVSSLFCSVAFVNARATTGNEKFESVSLNLSENVTMNYKLTGLDKNVNYTVKFTFGEEEPIFVDVPVSTDGEANVPFASITPKCFDKSVKAELYAKDSETPIAENTTSAKEYLYNLLTSSPEALGVTCEKYEKLKALAVDMLYYGEAIQIKYIQSGFTPVTDGLTDAQKAYATAFKPLDKSADTRKISGVKSDEFTWVNAGVRFDYNVSLYFTIKPTSENAKLSLKVGDDVVSAYEVDGETRKYRYEKVGVLDFDKVYTINIVNEAGEAIGETLSYSVNGYVYAKQSDTADMAAVVKAVYNYGVSAYAYDTAKEAHTYKLIPEYGTDYTAAENTLGKWQTCEYCHKKSYTQYATAVNDKGNIKKTHSDDGLNLGPYEYVYMGGDRTQLSSYKKTDTRVALASTSFNMGTNGSQTYIFKVTATAGKAKVIIRARNTTLDSAKKYNEEYQLNKSLTLTVNGTDKKVPSSLVLKKSPEIIGGAVFDEYQLTVADLVEGENTITLTFKAESIDGSGNKAKGLYLQYLRLETTTDCNGAHNIVYAEKVEAGCRVGMEARYECTTCGMYFKLDKVTEVSEAELEIAEVHTYDVPEKVDETNHKLTCVLCGESKTVAHTGSGENHLVVAKRPNRVWYYEGETLKDIEEDVIVNGSRQSNRMKLYTTNLCADGCGSLTAYTGEYTVTYQHGEAFTAGDTFVTLTAEKDGVTYTGILDGLTVVKNADDILNIDDAGITVVSGAFSQRCNDDGHTYGEAYYGQSAYGGYYIHEIKTSVTLKFNATKTSGKLTVQAGSNNPGGGIPKRGVKVNGQIKIYLNGKEIKIAENVILHGTVGKLNERWAWTVWETLDLGDVELKEGENEIKVEKVGKGDYALVDIDCFNIFY